MIRVAHIRKTAHRKCVRVCACVCAMYDCSNDACKYCNKFACCLCCDMHNFCNYTHTHTHSLIITRWCARVLTHPCNYNDYIYVCVCVYWHAHARMHMRRDSASVCACTHTTSWTSLRFWFSGCAVRVCVCVQCSTAFSKQRACIFKCLHRPECQYALTTRQIVEMPLAVGLALAHTPLPHLPPSCRAHTHTKGQFYMRMRVIKSLQIALLH